jgi:allantoicase
MRESCVDGGSWTEFLKAFQVSGGRKIFFEEKEKQGLFKLRLTTYPPKVSCKVFCTKKKKI